MSVPRGGETAPAKLLALLAAELNREEGPGEGLSCRIRRGLAGRYLAVTPPGRRSPLRVQCLSLRGRYAFLTGDGDLIGAADLEEAARTVAAAARAGG
jgi:hypothetical protein